MNVRRAFHLAALAALLAKLVCAALTHGTNDVDTFYNFGRFIWEHGLLAQYRATLEFNHPPVTGWFVALLYGLSGGLGFHFLLRLPGILADYAVVRLLLARGGDTPPWALLLLALSPVSFMVSGFHGNLDGVLTWLLVLAALECERGRPAHCALWFGLACQVKVIPLLVAPVFFFFWLGRGKARQFFVVAGGIILAGWSVPLMAMPEIFVKNVLGYSSNWGAWGITWWLTWSGSPAFTPVGFSGLSAVQQAVMGGLKIVIILAALGFAWTRRALPGREIFGTLALVWLTFFVFAPGVGTQYLVWLAPFLLVFTPRSFAVVTAASSVFCFAFYNTISGGLPWNFGASTAELVPRWAAWSNVAWLSCLAALLASFRWFRSNRPPPRAAYASSSSSSPGSA